MTMKCHPQLNYFSYNFEIQLACFFYDLNIPLTSKLFLLWTWNSIDKQIVLLWPWNFTDNYTICPMTLKFHWQLYYFFLWSWISIGNLTVSSFTVETSFKYHKLCQSSNVFDTIISTSYIVKYMYFVSSIVNNNITKFIISV